MATTVISNELVAIVIATALIYYYLYNHPTRWVRMTGCVGIMLVPLTLVAVQDSVIMYVLWLVNLMIGGIKFTTEVAEIIPTR